MRSTEATAKARTRKSRHSVLAIIPARGASKGLVGKNTRLLAGRPLIGHTIECALHSKYTNRVIVTTDDETIAETARSFGAEVPFLRPSYLAADDTPTVPVILHALRWLVEHEGYQPDYLVVLQPTSPLRLSADVDNALRLLIRQNGDAVVAVTPVTHHPLWTKTIARDGRLQDYLVSPEKVPLRRQHLPDVYALNGAIYAASTAFLVAGETFYADRTYAYVMPPERSIDIDTAWDLHLANLILTGTNDRD